MASTTRPIIRATCAGRRHCIGTSWRVAVLWMCGQTLLAMTAGASEDPAAQPAVPERLAVHAQFTYVEQETNSFRAPYAGANSLSPKQGRETADITLYLGARLSRATEIWINPELDQGFGLDNTLGTAGFPSGEAYKVGKKAPYLRLPRFFIRATVDLAGDREIIEAQANQLGRARSVNRWVFTFGKFAVGDIFDVNQYAHDPRADFFNWAAVDAGTFDYAADAWGYTVGAAAEKYHGAWAARIGIFDLSTIPNSAHLDPGFHEFQAVAEIEKRHQIGSQPGKLMITMFDTRGRMGLLDSAVQRARSMGAAVDIATVRQYRSRLGGSLSLEQQLLKDLGLFARLGRAAGNVEAYEFTDIDRSVAWGLSLKGTTWHREHDNVGLAAINNGISAARERFLRAGGLGILVGDGQLRHPGPEKIIETYYDATVFPHAQLTFDYQRIENPAYNRERGPASVFALRFHAQF